MLLTCNRQTLGNHQSRSSGSVNLIELCDEDRKVPRYINTSSFMFVVILHSYNKMGPCNDSRYNFKLNIFKGFTNNSSREKINFNLKSNYEHFACSYQRANHYTWHFNVRRKRPSRTRVMSIIMEVILCQINRSSEF